MFSCSLASGIRSTPGARASTEIGRSLVGVREGEAKGSREASSFANASKGLDSVRGEEDSGGVGLEEVEGERGAEDGADIEVGAGGEDVEEIGGEAEALCDEAGDG